MTLCLHVFLSARLNLYTEAQLVSRCKQKEGIARPVEGISDSTTLAKKRVSIQYTVYSIQYTVYSIDIDKCICIYIYSINMDKYIFTVYCI